MPTQEPEEPKLSLIYLMPEAAALLAAGFLSWSVLIVGFSLSELRVFPETPVGGSLSALIYILAIAGAASLMYVLMKLKLRSVVRNMIRLGVASVIFLLANWYGGIYLSLAGTTIVYGKVVVLTVASIVSATSAYIIFRTRGVTQTTFIVALGVFAGTFLGIVVPVFTAFVLLVGLSVYDLIAVYRGPIGKLIEETDDEELVGAVFTYRGLMVGLGDMIFYSMLVSNAMVNFGFLQYASSLVGILLGVYLTFKMLERRETFPGLPFAIGLGLALMYTSIYLQEAVKFL